MLRYRWLAGLALLTIAVFLTSCSGSATSLDTQRWIEHWGDQEMKTLTLDVGRVGSDANTLDSETALHLDCAKAARDAEMALGHPPPDSTVAVWMDPVRKLHRDALSCSYAAASGGFGTDPTDIILADANIVKTDLTSVKAGFKTLVRGA